MCPSLCQASLELVDQTCDRTMHTGALSAHDGVDHNRAPAKNSPGPNPNDDDDDDNDGDGAVRTEIDLVQN